MGRIRQKPRVWRVDLQEGNRLAYVGLVIASSKEASIQQACDKFDVDLEHQCELIIREM